MKKKLPKEKRDRLILIAVSTGVVMALLWQGLIGWQKGRLQKMADQRVDRKIQVNNAQRLANSIEEIRAELEKKSGELKELESEMASGDMYSWIITKVNQFKTGYNVEIPQFSREVPTEVGILPDFPYKAALFNIRGKAYYHDFGRFIADFENTFPYLRIQNIELQPASNVSAGAAANTAAAGGNPEEDESEKLAFRMEIVTLINPTSL